MVEWFQEKYISREEHQSVVAYYRKLVVQLHGHVRELRAQVEALAGLLPEQEDLVIAADEPARIEAPTIRQEGNVIWYDFRSARPPT